MHACMFAPAAYMYVCATFRLRTTRSWWRLLCARASILACAHAGDVVRACPHARMPACPQVLSCTHARICMDTRLVCVSVCECVCICVCACASMCADVCMSVYQVYVIHNTNCVLRTRIHSRTRTSTSTRTRTMRDTKRMCGRACTSPLCVCAYVWGCACISVCICVCVCVFV